MCGSGHHRMAIEQARFSVRGEEILTTSGGRKWVGSRAWTATTNNWIRSDARPFVQERRFSEDLSATSMFNASRR